MSTATKMSLAEIRRYEGTLFIRNNTRATLTFNEEKRSLVLHPREIQVLPDYAVSLPGFAPMLSSGKITVSPDLEDEAAAVSDRYEAQRQSELEKLHAALEEPAQNRDMVVSLDNKGEAPKSDKCLMKDGANVFRTAAEIKEHVPPLCPQHKERQREFVYREDMVNGETVDRWDRVTIG